MLYKGYVATKNKKCIEKFKGRDDLKTLADVQPLNEYAGVLADDTILIDLDDAEQAEILMKIVEDLQLNCKVICTTRGKHFLFKNQQIKRCSTHTSLAIGLAADIKVGYKASYEVLKTDGAERFVEWDIEDGGDYQEIPKWLFPVKSKTDFVSMDAGDGRNQAFFNYILTLTGNDFTVDETRETIRLINKYVLKEPLPENELETILRDEAFQKPSFYNDKTFLFDQFAAYLITYCNIVKINNQLHIYNDGVYVVGYREIEKAMIQQLPRLRKTQRREVIDYLELIAKPIKTTDARYIAFRNGILDLEGNKLLPFSPAYVLTNKIDWDYNPEAYSEVADRVLDKIACGDKEVRALLEECIGYCFYRRNEKRKAFILVGGKRNGKSTFLDCIKAILGDENISALDLSELGDRFSTAMMFGKLANIGDDIGDDFLQGSQVAMFKKIVAGNRIKAERKGQDPFEFSPYIKLLFSANRIPRMKDKTGAVLDRLTIIPFDAEFKETDDDYDAWIKYRLIEKESIEYLIHVGIQGLNRILDEAHGFTRSKKVQREVDSYEEENNPIIGFIAEHDFNEFVYQQTGEVYRWYDLYCRENKMTPMSKIVFSKELCKRCGLVTKLKKVKGHNYRVFERM